jgi:uncharacterized protein Veg
MNKKTDIQKIKNSLEKKVGCTVKLKTKSGRKKFEERRGIIESTYPSVFTVKLDSSVYTNRTVSYSYIDVLTKTVELVVCSDNSVVNF